MIFTRSSNTGIVDDVNLNLEGSNILQWAHGAYWPQIHSEAGFVTINWKDNTCIYKSSKDNNISYVYTFLIFICIFFPILITWFPYQNNNYIHFVRIKKPFLCIDITYGGVIMILIYLIIITLLSLFIYQFSEDIYENTPTRLQLVTGYFIIM
jgi:hypothetical protein